MRVIVASLAGVVKNILDRQPTLANMRVMKTANKGMDAMTISSRTDIETYVANWHADLGDGAAALLVGAIQDADHPAYGRDWSEWLDANVDAIKEGI
jgi:hypothetical protein